MAGGKKRVTKGRPRNPVCVLLWRDASWSHTKKPPGLPPLQLTTGFIIETNDEFTNIAMSVNYNPITRNLWPVDGFIIPKKAIVKFKLIGFLNA